MGEHRGLSSSAEALEVDALQDPKIERRKGELGCFAGRHPADGLYLEWPRWALLQAAAVDMKVQVDARGALVEESSEALADSDLDAQLFAELPPKGLGIALLWLDLAAWKLPQSSPVGGIGQSLGEHEGRAVG